MRLCGLRVSRRCRVYLGSSSSRDSWHGRFLRRHRHRRPRPDPGRSGRSRGSNKARLSLKTRLAVLRKYSSLLSLVQNEDLWITEELLRWIVDQLSPDDLIALSPDQQTLPGIYQRHVPLRTSLKPSSVVFVEGGTNSRKQDDTGASDFAGSLT